MKWIHSANQIPTENNYEDIARPALAQAWRSFFDYNPQKGILVMATQLGEALEIYNFTDTTPVSYTHLDVYKRQTYI